MVRKAIVKDLCDQCLNDTAQDLEVDADYCLVITLNENMRYSVDLCKSHAEDMTLVEVLESAHLSGKDKDRPPKPTKEKIRCHICGKAYSKGSGMALHIKGSHPEEYNKHKVIVT